MAPSPTSDMSEAKFLTVAEVATVMRVSKMTVYRLVHNGELPAVRVGRSFRVLEETSTSTSARASSTPAERPVAAGDAGVGPDGGAR